MIDVGNSQTNVGKPAISGAANSLLTVDWCFLGLGIIILIEMKEEGIQVGVGAGLKSASDKEWI